jgi:hypothetical protein
MRHAWHVEINYINGITLASIARQTGKSLLLPKVRVFFEQIADREDAATWGLKDINRFWLGETAGYVP